MRPLTQPEQRLLLKLADAGGHPCLIAPDEVIAYQALRARGLATPLEGPGRSHGRASIQGRDHEPD